MIAKTTPEEKNYLGLRIGFSIFYETSSSHPTISFFLLPGLVCGYWFDWRSGVLLRWCLEPLCCLIEC
jgi:hypothetical protein